MSDKDIKDSISSKLARIRLKARLTQKEAAENAGLNINYYAKIERGESMPSIRTLKKISDAFDVKSIDLLPF